MAAFIKLPIIQKIKISTQTIHGGGTMFLSDGDRLNSIARTTDLIANFKPYWRAESKNSFAEGWKMAVGHWYKDQLDIFFTDRIIKGKKQSILTQGPCFSFSCGHIIYNSPIAYTANHWRDAIPYIDICVKITSATPNTLMDISDSNGKVFKEGFVQFNVLRPQKISEYKTSKLITESTHTLSQNDFVRGLMNGMETVI